MSSNASVDLRPSSPATLGDALRAPSRSSYLAPTSSLAHSSSDDSHEPSPANSSSSHGRPTSLNLHSTAGTSPAPGLVSEPSPSPGANPYLFPYQPPDPSPPPLGNPYFSHGVSPPPMGGGGYAAPRTSRLGGDPMLSFGQAAAANAADDELTLGMRGMALNGGGTSAAGANGGGGMAAQHPPFSPEPFSPTMPTGLGGGASDGPPPRQNSLPYGAAPYYLPPGSPYNNHQELYAAPPPPLPPMPTFGAPAYYSNDASDGSGSRRGSLAPWGLPMPPFALPPDFAQSPSGPASRQGSFSYGAQGVPGMPPYAPPPPQQGANAYGSSHLDAAAAAAAAAVANGAANPYGPGGPAGAPPPGPYGAGPQLGQQHQIILGRGVRGMEYVAPGPVPQHGYGNGYGPDMRSLRSPLLEDFRSNRNRSWELSVRPSPSSSSAAFLPVSASY